MSNLHFNPMPDTHRRGIVRWILLALNVFPFAGLVFAYPTLLEVHPAVLMDNRVRLAIQVWAVLILLHLLFVVLLEIRENIVMTRRTRRRQREFEQSIRQQRRARYGQIFGKTLNDDSA